MLAPLRLAAFGGENYKAFQGPFEFEVAPLNVVFGRNGAGKTALLRLPLAITAALAGGEAAGLPLRVRNVALGNSLLSFVHGGVIDRYRLSARFEQGDRRFELEAVVHRDPKTTYRLPGQSLERWALRDESGELVQFESSSEGYRSLSGHTDVPVTFEGLVPTLADGTALPMFAPLRSIARVLYLGAARGVPGEDFVPEQPNVPLDVESDGAATRRVLGYLSGRRWTRPILGRVVDAVRDCLGIDLRVEEFAQGAISGTILQAKPCRRSTWLPISELGTGLAHALPLLVQYAIAAEQTEPTLVLCEEPEAHTHPEVHARLADFIARSVCAGGASSIVETHSETFVLRLRRRVAEGVLRPDQVAFYWIDDESEPTTVRRLQLDERGHVEDWPEGWFDAPLHEVREMQRALGGR